MVNECRIHTHTNQFPNTGLLPFSEVASLPTPHVEHFSAPFTRPNRSRRRKYRMSEASNEYRLHPIVETFETNNGGLQALLNTDLRTHIICEISNTQAGDDLIRKDMQTYRK